MKMSEQNLQPFRNEPVTNFSFAENQRAMSEALAEVRKNFGEEYLLVIGGERRRGEQVVASENPAEPSEVVGRIHFASAEDANRAVTAAAEAYEKWSQTPVAERARCMIRAAEVMRKRRLELAAWEILECGKIWEEADADVAEAIDYLEFYARETLHLAEKRLLGDAPGETNEYFYEPRGVAAIISPWNFPLAILCGMSSAAIVTGNTVILKPSGQSCVSAAKLMEIYEEGGLPAGVVNYVPGRGSVIGEIFVKHPKVSLIAFTGSVEVGLRINKQASEVQDEQHFVKKVITEMGGKNAIIVDSTADLDEAVKGVVTSAFGYQGQKCSACSRVVVVGEVYDTFLSRLVNATRSIVIGKPEEPETFLGALIDKKAAERTREYIEIGKKEAKVALEMEVPGALGKGYFVAPVIFCEVPVDSRIAQEEIFAPVLAVMRAGDFEEALKVANATRFALTGGVFSRTPEHIELAKREFKTGNLYINRKITGAIVGRQPFGGFRLSGIGSKAGGQDYLQQFLLPRTITENTMRHGFAPIEDVD
jgi:RHH-type proline utilization regulon transcriptional repressor/proline dehydrogenase/delta 1-pyrroline-5-carboxylate dehydrogenase